MTCFKAADCKWNISLTFRVSGQRVKCARRLRVPLTPRQQMVLLDLAHPVFGSLNDLAETCALLAANKPPDTNSLHSSVPQTSSVVQKPLKPYWWGTSPALGTWSFITMNTNDLCTSLNTKMSLLLSYLKHFWFLSCLYGTHYMITVRGIMTLLSNEVVCCRPVCVGSILSLHSRWFCVMDLDLSGVH